MWHTIARIICDAVLISSGIVCLWFGWAIGWQLWQQRRVIVLRSYMGDVGIVVTFLNDIFKYATEPSGYEEWALEKKLDILGSTMYGAIAEKDWDAVDRCHAELSRLRQQFV